ncbi:MAG: polyamine aminopropyltransferase [Firmicutes bacterium]|nr:polyamine aminopropyltransferase [Bacillota bacterium]
MQLQLWFIEEQAPGMALALKATGTVYREKTKYQDLTVIETVDAGRALVLDDCIQTSDMDEFIYHEMIAHVPLCTHPLPEKVLVVGGGDGGSIREILKHDSVKEAVLAEIDERVIEAAKKYLPNTSCRLDDPRCRVVIGDGFLHVNTHPGEYDVILCDSTDPVGPGIVLFSEEFYQGVYSSLKDDGIFVAQTESPFYYRDLLARVSKTLKGIFPIVKTYVTVMPTYPGALWTFTLASKEYDPVECVRRLDLETRFYTPELHKASFALPRLVKDIVGA